MQFRAKLNLKFYIISLLLFGIVIFGWYGIYFLNANEILMEDDTPMSYETKLFFTVALSMIVLSWTMSLFTLIRQIIIGCAFYMDEDGIHSTATAVNVLAFIFVVPIKTIPCSAVQKISEEDGVLTLYLDKSQISVLPFLKVFASKRYHLFSGFTVEKQEDIKSELNRFIKEYKES